MLDEELHRIESSDIRGGNRTILFESQNLKPVAMTVHQSYIYWINREAKILQKVNKFNGRNHQILKVSHLPTPCPRWAEDIIVETFEYG